MKYMGSKARISKDISPIINRLIQENNITVYVEPFVGGANMIQHIQCANKYGYDNNKYLIAFWQAIQRGWNPLKEVEMSKELYQKIKANPDNYALEVVALAGFCATYNAKWFGGYAGIVKTKIETFRNYYDEAVRNVLKQAEHIKDVKFIDADFQKLNIENALIYCDPPYEGTTGYHYSFDHQAYWEWVRKMSEKNIVLCSEYSAPPDFECIWQKQLTTTLDKNSRSKSTEKLFQIKQVKEEKQMELKVIDVQLPEQISFNYEELKAELMAKVSVYENMVYSGEEEIKTAKVDRANLNKLKKALNDERIRREKEYMQPFNDFKAKINEIIQIIDKPVLMIDSQVKAFEEQTKIEKRTAIEAYFEGRNPIEWLKLEQIFNEKWLNASVKMPNVTTEIDSAIEQIEKDLETLRNLPEFGFKAVEEYKRSLDLNKAIAEGHRLSEIQKRKAEEIARLENAAVKPTPNTAISTETVEPQTEPQKDWVSFKALLSTDDALALKEFFDSRNIEFEAI